MIGKRYTIQRYWLKRVAVKLLHCTVLSRACLFSPEFGSLLLFSGPIVLGLDHAVSSVGHLKKAATLSGSSLEVKVSEILKDSSFLYDKSKVR